jgi:hypothetical protein
VRSFAGPGVLFAKHVWLKANGLLFTHCPIGQLIGCWHGRPLFGPPTQAAMPFLLPL